LAKNLFTAILERKGDGYVALCPELDIVSQGKTVGEATTNLKEAVELFLETADHAEIQRRLDYRIVVTTFEARHG
jgi:predicted RNase H-like HicB family nuclease